MDRDTNLVGFCFYGGTAYLSADKAATHLSPVVQNPDENFIMGSDEGGAGGMTPSIFSFPLSKGQVIYANVGSGGWLQLIFDDPVS